MQSRLFAKERVKSMLLIDNRATDPAYNLATEEYLLTEMREEIASLWRNRDAVIIGRNQNALEEMDLRYIEDNNITVIRRLTGGGAVFHDLGNLNFTFIEQNRAGMFGDYARFTAPIRDYLRTLGVNCELSGRNDLAVDGMKVSGNAQTVKSGRILHHGTLLLSANMGRLAGALRVRDIKVESRGIKSHRSRVTNIAEHLPEPMSAEQFRDGLFDYFEQTQPGIRRYELSAADDAAIRALVEEKYGRWEWNFGATPRYTLKNAVKYDFGIVEAFLETERAVIRSVSLRGDFFGIREITGLEQRLEGCPHRREDIADRLESFPLGEYISGMTAAKLAELLA